MKTNYLFKIIITFILFTNVPPLSFGCDVFAQTKELWGMTLWGGQYSSGTIFKTDGSGNNQIVQHSFFRVEGTRPFANLTQASDGKLYGMTYSAGTNDGGVLFQYDLVTNTYIKKLDFGGATDGLLYATDGLYPSGSLIQASDGKLYGMTTHGGTNNMGVLFQYDPATNTYSKKLDFDGATNGSRPYGSLMQASDGKLYGMSYSGGANDMGALFQYDPSTNIYSKKLDFDGTNGAQPYYGSLMQASDGKLYGTTSGGGTDGMGVLFQYDPITNTYIKKLDFDGATNGGNPNGSLMQASDGKLYGMTGVGTNDGYGVLFQYDPATNTYSKKLDFDGANGATPYGSLSQALDGKLYGMTSGGGTNDMGVLFQYDPITGTYTKKLDFDGTNGKYPFGSLMQASDGKLYGMSYNGGANDLGALFQYDPSTNICSKKLDFDGTNGRLPRSPLMQASDGKLYGMTEIGGTNNKGVLFQYDPVTITYTKKVDFDDTNGEYPQGSLMQASDGKLYGMATFGGLNGIGVLFQYDPVIGTFTKKVDFDYTNGGSPQGSLMQASDGKLYGITTFFGKYERGVLFQYDPATNTYTKKLDFDGTNGGYPQGSLMQASDGKLYGMTYRGGTNNMGVLFQYDPATNTYTKKLDFDGTNGRRPYPYSSLIQASDEKLYGMTYNGGTYDYGVLFQYDYTIGIYTKKLDFDGTNGANPDGSLMQASNGKLYGVTLSGGTDGDGVLFQYDPVTGIYTKKIDFYGSTNGGRPIGTLIEIEVNSMGITNNIISSSAISIYPNPTSSKITLQFTTQYPENAVIKISDMTGKIVFSHPYHLESDVLEMDVAGLTTGIYLLQLQSGGKLETKKFIVME